MTARFLALLFVGLSAAAATAEFPGLLPTAEELNEAKTLSARQLLYCQRLVAVRRNETEVVNALFKTGNASKDEAEGAAGRLKAAEQQLAQVKSGKAWQPAKEAEPANYDDALARLTRGEQIAKTRVEAGLAPVSAILEARRQRLRLQWTFGPKEMRPEVAAELLKVLRELLAHSAALRSQGFASNLDEIEVRRDLIAALPAAEAVKERQAIKEHVRQNVAALQARREAGIISSYEVYRGTAAAIEALLAIDAE
jgi:hypothetical protein